ncbi:glycosyltransferase family 4 protein [Fulvivirga ligni]|uniref:glycosyltransferase family 4 protein n=1 Tax=Fulvivirga ligni TaxID=2904246 RepID=UPI001F1C850F|nr:glycosyltransferase [Fulvivirga ligni]UII19453.1 glycosyltransferase [Fulvivirga ligni]
MKHNYKSIFATFDPYPSYKGSAIHIEKVTEQLAGKFPDTLLVSLQKHTDKRFPEHLDHLECPIQEPNYLKRALKYSEWLDGVLDNQLSLQIGHFRDVWSGKPILERAHITSVFEVNGLPSIELVNRYPYIGNDTIEKIVRLEDECLQKSQLIVCPSQTIKQHLLKRHVLEDKIHVLPNGADLIPAYSRPDDMPDQYIVYFGALQPWQGVDVLVKAMQYLQDKPEIKLVICSSHKPKFSRPFYKLIGRLGLEDQIIWRYQLHKNDLHRIIQHAMCTVAPLTECERNLEQGCSPLKIFESMACKTPIIASDLPVIREILTPDEEVKLCRPGRPADVARCIRLLADYPDFREKLAQNAYAKFISNYTWEDISKRLSVIYDNIFKLTF